MTNIQIEEFQKLEMAYLDSVRQDDPSKQIQMMELIFFWLRKQMRFGRGQLGLIVGEAEPVEVTEIQKQEFTFLQMAMIKAVGRGDREAMVQVELKMREWIDILLSEAVSRLVKPEMKIIRKGEN